MTGAAPVPVPPPVFDALFGCLAGFLGLVACSESLLAQLQMDGHGRVVECLVIRVAQHERHVVDAFAVHVVHGIAATATNTNHFDDAILFLGFTEIQYIEIWFHILLFLILSLITYHFSLITSFPLTLRQPSS